MSARACEFCRVRKIRCDAVKPTCGSCSKNGRRCLYVKQAPRERPTRKLIDDAQRRASRLEALLLQLRQGSPSEREKILDSLQVHQGSLSLAESTESTPAFGATKQTPADSESSVLSPTSIRRTPAADCSDASSDEEPCDVSTFLSVNEKGEVGSYGPSSAWTTGDGLHEDVSRHITITETDRYKLIADAALQRQKEHELRLLGAIGGIPAELAIHLLDLHWSRAHHTFLLTYRPAIVRDILRDGGLDGPYCSEFLLNAIFAVTSKFSDRVEIRENPNDPLTAGKIFFRRIDELLARDKLLSTASIPTIVALLILAGTYNATGLSSSTGWLYAGYALRMVYDLGLHLDSKDVVRSAEDLEVRRRVFWGAFVIDKLMSLYFGRPVTIQLKDAHVSRTFMDTYEELEHWQPYVDPKTRDTVSTSPANSTPLHSVSTFQHLCSLARIMTRIMNKIYRIGATAENSRPHLTSIDSSLESWYHSLPNALLYEPWRQLEKQTVAPNIITLLTTWNACVILLHRPFISCGHLKATNIPSNSWKRCNTAAGNITNLALAYRSAYGLRRASYLLSYAVYVACTIHVRNTAVASHNNHLDQSSALKVSLNCLDELVEPNFAIANPAKIIRRLMGSNSQTSLLNDSWGDGDFTFGVSGVDQQNMYESLSTPFSLGQVPDHVGFPTFETIGADPDLLFGFMDETAYQQALG